MGSKSGETFDDSSVSSIVQFGKLLIDKSLAESSNITRDQLIAKGKGGLGLLVESAFFDLPNSNKPEPDFERAGLELKTTGLQRHKKNGLQAKEFLKLTSLNADEVDTETWETSRVVRKCGLMLVLTYFYDKDQHVSDLKFTQYQTVINLLDPESVDVAQFKSDFEKIQSFVRAGRTSELSSGDTNYLVAKTSGPGKGKGLRHQPNSPEKYEPRAFTIRDSYMTQLLLGRSGQNDIPNSLNLSIEEATELTFRPLIGKTLDELSVLAQYDASTSNNKASHHELAIRLLGGGKDAVNELEKANIKLKTIRLSKSGVMREQMSFRQFKYLDIYRQDWEDSTFNEDIQQKLLLVIFRERDDGSEVLYKVGYWNMPFVDRQDAKLVWEETKRRVQANNYELPKISEMRVAHVRPKGANKLDKYPTPQGGHEQKNCFWLNKGYLQEIVDLLPGGSEAEQ